MNTKDFKTKDMTYFYEGDCKWPTWLEQHGLHDVPDSGNAAEWPKFMWKDIQRVKEEWKSSPRRESDWERLVLGLPG